MEVARASEAVNKSAHELSPQRRGGAEAERKQGDYGCTSLRLRWLAQTPVVWCLRSRRDILFRRPTRRASSPVACPSTTAFIFPVNSSSPPPAPIAARPSSFRAGFGGALCQRWEEGSAARRSRMGCRGTPCGRPHRPCRSKRAGTRPAPTSLVFHAWSCLSPKRDQ